MSQECPCCSGEQYSLCCAPYIDGTQIPATAERLMRSRYTAYVQHNAAYLVATWHPTQQRPELLPALTESFAGSEWLGLNVTRCFAGLHENEAFVTFFARYREKAQLHHLHECSRFVREDQRWYYIDGTAPELGRNDPCPCGSGKKYKKCCN